MFYLLLYSSIVLVSCNESNNTLLYDAESEGPIQCYSGSNNGSRVITCDTGHKCCHGIVKSELADNETAPVEWGGCWHQATTCPALCEHKYIPKAKMSFCECKGDLCNKEMVYKAPPVVTVPVPVPEVEKGAQPWKIVLITILVIALVACLCFATFKVWRKFRPKNNGRLEESGGAMETFLPSFPNGTPMPAPFDKDIELQQNIGYGRFGQVFKAAVDNRFIAVKMFEPINRASFMNELLIMSLKADVNILPLVGYVDMSSKLWLLTEFMCHGNLCEYLRANILSVAQALHLLNSFVGGLAYLHTDPQAVAHRDIKSRNILMQNHKSCKIADFGLALLLDYGPGGALNEKAAPPTQVGTPRYMAPEVLEGSMFYREAEAHMRIDVYAASLVMWEIMSRTQLDQRDNVPPYQLPFERQYPGHPTTLEMQVLVARDKQRPDLRAQWNSHQMFNKLEITLTESWDMDENARLSAKTIQARVTPLLSSENDAEVSV